MTELYDQYVIAASARGITPTPYAELIETVTNGERGNFSIEESVCSVLKASIWMFTTSLEEKEQLAG